MIKAKSSYFLEQIDSANSVMENIGLPTKISDEIREHLIKTQTKLDQQLELDQFLGLISQSLKLKVTWQIFEGVVRFNPVFKNLQKVGMHGYLVGGEEEDVASAMDIVSLVVRRLQIQLSGPSDIIIRQGDEDQDMYFVAKGDSFVSVKDTRTKEHKNFKKLVPGDHFGEMSIIHKCPRTATVTSGNYTTFAKLPIENYRFLLSEIPEMEEALRKYSMITYNDKVKLWLAKTLTRLPFFQDIEPWTFHRILYSMKQRYLDKGQIIFKRNDDVDHLRIVQDGIIDLYVSGR